MPLRCLLTFAFVTLSLSAQDAFSARIDAVFEQWNKPATPGAAVAVIRDGKLIYEKGYGLANLEYDIPINPETVFHVASVTKQFTAMALVLLEEDGKLSIDDDVHKYLPELPDYGHKIAIRNLLQHTSGIRDQWQTLGIAGWRLDDVITQQQILRVLFRQKELNFVPGTQHLYSNGGYTLAAEIVARVSGMSFPEFCAKRIFQPLDMSHTHIHDDLRRIVPHRAYSYDRRGNGFEASPLNYANAGATSLFTTAPDLVRWLDNFREPKVGGKRAIARMEEQAVLADGKKIDYALGVSVGKYRGLPTVSHNGADAGYRSIVLWFPDQSLGIAVLSNVGNFNTTNIANKVAEVFLEDKMTSAPAPDKAKDAPRTYITVEPATLPQYAGNYSMGPGLILNMSVKDGKLFGGPLGQTQLELKPIGPARFYTEQQRAELQFTPKTGGGMSLRFIGVGGTIDGERVTSDPFDPSDLPKYAGVYWSDELETQYTIVAKEGKLFAEHIRHGEIALSSVAKDQFRSGTWFMSDIHFRRGADGKVTAMVIGGGRITGIEFVKR
jgi:CubicO group peptidase (beta-lactamase class C family)